MAQSEQEAARQKLAADEQARQTHHAGPVRDDPPADGNNR